MDDRADDRFFSIASAPYEREIRITARYPDQPSSFKKALHDLPLGAEIDAEYPTGDFIIEDPSPSYVFLAGGIGITAFRPMLLDLAYKNQPINVTLIYANRSPDSILFKEDLEKLLPTNPNFKVHYLYDPERIDQNLIEQYVPDISDVTFYISGPEPMVESLYKMIEDMGVRPEKIKHDHYPGYTNLNLL